MSREEFTHPVGGSGGRPIDVSAVDSIETDEYRSGGTVTSSAYPISIAPTDVDVIEEVIVFQQPDAKVWNLTTTDGDTINGIEPKGAAFTLDTLEISEIEITDPDGLGGTTSLLYVGD